MNGRKQAYRELLRDVRWQKRRLEILNRDSWCCRSCGAAEGSFEIHHIRYLPGLRPWDYEGTLLATLCSSCHGRVSKGERIHIADVGEHIRRMVTVERSREGTMGSPWTLLRISALLSEREILLARPWSKAASRRVEVIDAQFEMMWELLERQMLAEANHADAEALAS